ncbi:hypothetical protein [Actinomadura formosensis]
MKSRVRRVAAVLVPMLVLVAACSPASGQRDAKRPVAAKTAGAAVRKSENEQPGTPGWRIRHKGAEHEIVGYADHVSVLPGGSFRLFVSTTTPGFTA